MKKFISILITVVLCFSSVTAFAKTPLLDESLTMMGDADENGRITAADARIVLRVAAKIDAEDSINFCNTDADDNGKITASDARIILRVAASLSEFIYGFDGNGVPCALNVLKGDKYFIDVSYKDPTSSTTVSMSLARNNENIYLISDDMGFDMSELGFSECGMMINENKVYALLGNSTTKAAMYIPDSMCEDMGMSKEELNEISELISSFIANDIGTASRVVHDGETVFCYTYDIMGDTYFLYVGTNGQLLSVDGKSSSGNESFVIFNEISVDSVSSYFDLNKYELI